MLRCACVHNMIGVTSQPRRLRTAVRAALDARDAADSRDVGTEQLALRYAGLIDDAAPAAKYRRPLDALNLALLQVDDQDAVAEAVEALRKIRDALAHHSVLSDLGPKLLAALEALQLTPRARTAVMKGGNGGSAPASPLDELRARRAARANRATTVDAAAP